MVAGGVPDRRANHAESIAAVALEFRTKVKQIDVPDTHQLLIRIGQSGSLCVRACVRACVCVSIKTAPDGCCSTEDDGNSSRSASYTPLSTIFWKLN